MKEETQEIINKAGNRISHLSKYLGLAARVEPHKDHDLFFSKPVATDFADFVKKGMAEGVTIDLKYIPSGASTYEDIRINMLRIGAPSEMLAALDEALLQYQV